jgi:hypothetical protein
MCPMRPRRPQGPGEVVRSPSARPYADWEGVSTGENHTPPPAIDNIQTSRVQTPTGPQTVDKGRREYTDDIARVDLSRSAQRPAPATPIERDTGKG